MQEKLEKYDDGNLISFGPVFLQNALVQKHVFNKKKTYFKTRFLLKVKHSYSLLYVSKSVCILKFILNIFILR